MEISPELAAVVDHLRARHPAFRRATVERLVLRMAREVAGQHGELQLGAVLRSADEQLTYVDESDADRPLRRSG